LKKKNKFYRKGVINFEDRNRHIEQQQKLRNSWRFFVSFSESIFKIVEKATNFLTKGEN